MFRGSIVPIVTPFKNGDVDYDGLQRLIDFQISNGAHGISVTVTTGEPSSLTTDERKECDHCSKPSTHRQKQTNTQTIKQASEQPNDNSQALHARRATNWAW